MVLNYVPPMPDYASTVDGATTPPETVADFLENEDPLGKAQTISSSVPWPDSTFLIRSVASGNLITLLNGQIILAPPGGPGSIRWACVETKGWLGFRDVISGRFLGHDNRGKLHCKADRHQGWEHFCVRMTPDGGYLLLMTHFERLWHVGITVEQGTQKLAKIGETNGTIWEFIKV